LIVVDASAILEVLLRTPAAEAIEERIFAPETTIHAPHLIDLEIAQVLRRYVRSSQLKPERGSQALQDLQAFPLNRYPHEPFLARIWELRHNVTAYDAAYLALAEALPAPLVTRDTRLLAIDGISTVIEVI
jgi:predicted nucleic acid-binding protein